MRTLKKKINPLKIVRFHSTPSFPRFIFSKLSETFTFKWFMEYPEVGIYYASYFDEEVKNRHLHIILSKSMKAVHTCDIEKRITTSAYISMVLSLWSREKALGSFEDLTSFSIDTSLKSYPQHVIQTLLKAVKSW